MGSANIDTLINIFLILAFGGVGVIIWRKYMRKKGQGQEGPGGGGQSASSQGPQSARAVDARPTGYFEPQRPAFRLTRGNTAIAALVIVFLFVAVSQRARLGKMFGKKAAPALADPCAQCRVEKIPLDQLTCEKVKGGWRFLGHKCVGAANCDACVVADCVSEDMEVAPPANGCNRCSKTGD